MPGLLHLSTAAKLLLAGLVLVLALHWDAIVYIYISSHFIEDTYKYCLPQGYVRSEFVSALLAVLC